MNEAPTPPSYPSNIREALLIAKTLLQGDLTSEPFLHDKPPEMALEPKIANELFKVEHSFVPGGTVINLGGGVSLINGVLARLGMKVHVVDLLDSFYETGVSANYPRYRQQRDMLSRWGVSFIEADLLEYNFSDFGDGSVDAVISFHTFEHLHHPPRYLMERAVRVLRDDGIAFIEVPNAVSAWNRVKVAMGTTNYLPYQNFWRSYPWYGHVREYTKDDLEKLSSFSGFQKHAVLGRNYYSKTFFSKKRFGLLIKVVDRIIRLRPGLCASLFLRAEKPTTQAVSQL